VDAFVPRVQPEPLVANPHAVVRQQRRRRRERPGDDAQEPHFALEEERQESHAGHAQPRSPDEDGLGRNLDVTA
jgi:hypothetical protein